MEKIKKECQDIIDLCFNEQVYTRTGNKLEDQASLGRLLGIVTEKAVDNCLIYLNKQNYEIAKEIADSGFIADYISKKQKAFLGL